MSSVMSSSHTPSTSSSYDTGSSNDTGGTKPDSLSSNAFRSLLGNQQVPQGERAAMPMLKMARSLVSTDPSLSQQEAERIAHHEATYPLHMKIGAAFGDIRAAFEDIGLEWVDMIQIKQTADGTFSVSGWGIGETVSHPQGRLIEAIFNGEIPRFSETTEKIHGLIQNIEGWFGQVQDLSEDYAKQTGEPFIRKASIFTDNLVIGAEHLSRQEATARQLSFDKPEAFKRFRASLGSELEKLTDRQVLSRFYFDAATKPTLPDDLLPYLT